MTGPWTSQLSNTGSECEKDRILFFNREINNLKQLSYEVDENLLISDHRPVFGDFNLNVSHITGQTTGHIQTKNLDLDEKSHKLPNYFFIEFDRPTYRKGTLFKYFVTIYFVTILHVLLVAFYSC